MLDAYKELTPLVYGESAIKYFHNKIDETSGRMCFHLHWHDRMELIYVTGGTLELHTDEGHLSVQPGQVAVITPRQMHGGFAGPMGVDYHAIMFEVDKFCNSTIASNKYLVPLSENKIRFQNVVEDDRLRQVLECIVEVLTNKNEKQPLLAMGLIYAAFDILFRNYICKSKVIHAQDKGFEKILKHINDHYTEKCSSKEVSAKFGYTEAYFCRRFREVTGINFSKYVQALRMEYAQKLLKNSKDEIGIIAWKCGFSDLSYFSNCFKKLFGFTPTEFRNMKG